MPFTCQVTEVSDDPVTVALKDCVAPALTFALAGETTTVTPEPEGGVLELEAEELFVVPVQPASAAAAARNTKSSDCRKALFFNLSIRKRTKSVALKRRIACTALCLGVRRGTTVRKGKIRVGKREQAQNWSQLSELQDLQGGIVATPCWEIRFDAEHAWF